MNSHASEWLVLTRNFVAGSHPQNDSFSSKEIHVNSGMYYYGYRFYDPNLQRWINRDPIEEYGGLNLYSFDANDPLQYLDPYGLDSRTIGPITICLGFPPGTPKAVKDAEKAHEKRHRGDYWNLKAHPLSFWQRWELEQRGFAAEVPILTKALADPTLSADDRASIQQELNTAILISTSESAARDYTDQPAPPNVVVPVPSSGNIVGNSPILNLPRNIFTR